MTNETIAALLFQNSDDLAQIRDRLVLIYDALPKDRRDLHFYLGAVLPALDKEIGNLRNAAVAASGYRQQTPAVLEMLEKSLEAKDPLRTMTSFINKRPAEVKRFTGGKVWPVIDPEAS